MRSRAALVISAGLLTAAAGPPLPWAFPGLGLRDTAPPPNTQLRVAGSNRSYSSATVADMTRVPDWFPASHPLAPAPVLRGSAAAPACGYCHLPDGSGRPENADLRGLPVSYIEEQVHAFAEGTRRSADPDYLPTRLMAAVARTVRPADLRAAARYFASLEPVSHSRVVEAAIIPRPTPWHFVYRFDPKGREPIGVRIVEGPDDPKAFELRDPRARSTAWVPRGAVDRGRAIVEQGAPAVPACAGCHTADLVGIGGASPTFIARQLAGFRAKTRNDPGAAPMQAVAAKLTDAQIVDLAAYVGAHRPWTRAQMRIALKDER